MGLAEGGCTGAKQAGGNINLALMGQKAIRRHGATLGVL